MLNMPLAERFLELSNSCALNYFEISYKVVVCTSCFKTLWDSNWWILVLYDMFGFVSLDSMEKLHSQRQMDALRFIFAFGLVEKIPLVPLLKEYLKHQRKASKEIAKKEEIILGHCYVILIGVVHVPLSI